MGCEFRSFTKQFFRKIFLPLLVAGISVSCTEESPPSVEVSQDEYSGKTVMTREMAHDLMVKRVTNAPRVGETAPDFELLDLEGNAIALSGLIAEKPTVLLMSSWSCDTFRETSQGFLQLFRTYRESANFAIIYIREAHPMDGFAGKYDIVEDPKTLDHRNFVARHCHNELRLEFPILVDTMDDSVATRWGAWPIRAFVVEKSGKVSFAGMQGPWGYRPYLGYQNGTGVRNEWDPLYSQETLEEFLRDRFPKS